MKRAVIVGSGAGGATVAKELQGVFDVAVLEAGSRFRPFSYPLRPFEMLRRTGLMADERLIQLLYPSMRVSKSSSSLVIVHGSCVGGTTVLNTGNALRMDADLCAVGINLDNEFEELYQEIPISTRHQQQWGPITRQLLTICGDLALSPEAMPKAGHPERCARCGRCVLGCERGAKWDSREFLGKASAHGATVMMNTAVQHVVINDRRAVGVIARHRLKTQFYPADLVVLAAGGLGTPLILERSGFSCAPRLFVDPVLCVAAHIPGANFHREIPMPFVVQRDRFIISPYFDYVSFFFNKAWRYPAGDILSIMIKLADSAEGSVTARGIAKGLTVEDRKRLDRGVELSRQILEHAGADSDRIFLGTLNAGHPGGMLPLTEEEALTLHHEILPDNLYIADASLLPNALGNPPMLTIMSLAKRISQHCRTLA
jgi:choline dehydrogenase-like flavoprotein